MTSIKLLFYATQTLCINQQIKTANDYTDPLKKQRAIIKKVMFYQLLLHLLPGHKVKQSDQTHKQ